MNVMIELPLDRYDAFSSKCRTLSPKYAILLGAVIARRPKGDHYERVAEIACEIEERERFSA